MSAPRTAQLAGGGPLDGTVMPVTRRLENGADLVEVRSQINAEKAHIYQRDVGQRYAVYRGFFALEIAVPQSLGEEKKGPSD